MKKQKFLKNTITTATMFALLAFSMLITGGFLTQSVNAQSQQSTAESGIGPQDGGDGPKKPRPCRPSSSSHCHPAPTSAANERSSEAANESELSWLDSLWEWIFD